ncbi:Eefsec [Symbiodinium pilosum]|uniref:Eefsec protein n=1 Tax=Symbiodinium pilosum TaxID=2952 RepID=A0A812J1J4_SYMPI|nr:Eefsec [Symbiodinium pilosum]
MTALYTATYTSLQAPTATAELAELSEQSQQLAQAKATLKDEFVEDFAAELRKEVVAVPEGSLKPQAYDKQDSTYQAAPWAVMGNEKDEKGPKRKVDGSGISVKALNVNLGVLGHIDSGKTSICLKIRWTLDSFNCPVQSVTSTASMDKSKEVHVIWLMTLLLLFSPPDSTRSSGAWSIAPAMPLCGAQIIDLCALVIDVNKGIQTQTAECMVVAEILANQLVVILNKIDMIPAEKRKKILDKVIKELRKTFARTKFGSDLPFACVSAHPQDGSEPLGATDLMEVIKTNLALPQRDSSGPFMFAYDHAFAIKGQGTVLTGTVLSGAVKPQMGIVVPQLGEAGKGKKVRSLQMFRQPVQEAIQGDRVAMCVAALDAKELERGIVLGEKFPVPMVISLARFPDAAVCVVDKINYFKSHGHCPLFLPLPGGGWCNAFGALEEVGILPAVFLLWQIFAVLHAERSLLLTGTGGRVSKVVLKFETLRVDPQFSFLRFENGVMGPHYGGVRRKNVEVGTKASSFPGFLGDSVKVVTVERPTTCLELGTSFV